MDRSILSARRLAPSRYNCLRFRGSRVNAGARHQKSSRIRLLAWRMGSALMSGMERIVTLAERKAAEAERRQSAVDEMRPELAAYAREHGGRFLLFGSAARGQMRFDSDVDILVDFPPDALNDAWNFAERACWDRRLEPDITPFSWCKGRFRERVAPDLQVVA
jgi:predicted nucleotidyltransferase